MKQMCSCVVFDDSCPVIPMNRCGYFCIYFKGSLCNDRTMKILTIRCLLYICNIHLNTLCYQGSTVSNLSAAFCVERGLVKYKLNFISLRNFRYKLTIL